MERANIERRLVRISPPMPSMNAAQTVTEKEALSLAEIQEVWPLLTHADRIQAFILLPRDEAQDFFFGLDARDQSEVIQGLPAADQRLWIRFLPPDDAADLVQQAPAEHRARCWLSSTSRHAGRSRRCWPTPRTTPAA